MGDGEEGELEAGGDAGLVKDVGEVAFDGLFGDLEGVGDVFVGAAVGDAADDFKLARGEVEGARLGAAGGLLGELVVQLMEGGDEVFDAAAADPVVAVEDGADALLEVRGGGLLEDDAARAELEGFHDLLGGGDAGEQDDLDVAGAFKDAAQGFQTGDVRHLDVEQEDVRLKVEGVGDGLFAVGGLADDVKGVFRKEAADAEADDGVVVCDEDAGERVWHGKVVVGG